MKLRDDHRIRWEYADDFAPEHDGVMVTIIVERQTALVKFDNGDVHDGTLWVEVYDVLSEVDDPDDPKELSGIIENNYPEAFETET